MSHECTAAITQVYEYLDEELTWWRRQKIRWHLRKCPPCEGAFSFEARFKKVVREHTAEEPPPELMNRLRSFLRENGVEGI